MCQLIRVMELSNGHILMYGSSLLCPMSLVQLVCKIKSIRFFKLLDTDFLKDKWKKKFRSITKICGLDKMTACLYVPVNVFAMNTEVRACLESFIDIGYDLSLFNPEELEIMTQKPSYFLELSKHTKKNFHCVVVGKTFDDVENYFSNENFYVSNTGEYEDSLIEYAQELIKDDNHGIAYEVFKDIHERATGFFNNIVVQHGHGTTKVVKADLNSYVAFMEVFMKFIKTTIQDYQEILSKIETIVSHVQKHFEFSTEQMLILEKHREKSKATVAEHQAMMVKHVQTKKELKDIEIQISDGMNEYSDEQAAMLRLNMAIVEERTCQWSLFQRTLRDFETAVPDEGNVDDFNQSLETNLDIQEYLSTWRTAFEIGGENEDFCIKFKVFLSNVLEVYDVKALWQVGDNNNLHILKDKISHDVNESSVIIFSILKIHSRMEVMSKSMRNIQTKEQKLQVLQKKCKSIEERLKELRQQNKALEKRSQDETSTIEDLQTSIARQNETINTLEQSTTEHKNLKQPLEAFLDYLGKMKARMLDEKKRLPGSILLGAATSGYCGSLDIDHRASLIM